MGELSHQSQLAAILERDTSRDTSIADTDENGSVSLSEFVAYGLCLNIIMSEFRGKSKKLTFTDYSHSLCRIGFADVAKLFQGQLAEAVFNRLDLDGDGTLSEMEFVRGSLRMLHPE